MILFWFVIVMCIALTALCSLAAAAFTELSFARIAELAAGNHPRARQLHTWKTESERPLLAVRILAGTAHMAAALLAGIAVMDMIDGGGAALWGMALVAAITYILLLFVRAAAEGAGERNPATHVNRMALTIDVADKIMRPFAAPGTFLKNTMRGGDDYTEEEAREDIDDILETAHEEGSLDPDEYRFLKSIMKFHEVLVADVMTPRTVVFGCDADLTIEQTLPLHGLRQYSRFPVWEANSPDRILGYVRTKDVLWAAINSEPESTLRDLVRDVHMIPKTAPLDDALEDFLKRRGHLFIAVDEYGGVEGIITMEDVLETILGEEILDEDDRIKDLREYAKRQREKRLTVRNPSSPAEPADEF